jgi:hypothetical protein
MTSASDWHRRVPPRSLPSNLSARLSGSREERKIDIGEQWRPESHRSGWPYALDALADLHVPGGVLLEGFIEKKFAWGGDSGDLRNDPQPHTRPWVGFWHNPPTVHESFNRVGHAPGDILASELWRQSVPHCRGLFTFSRHLRKWLEPRVPVPVCNLLHPTGRPVVAFSPWRYAANQRKKIVQVGWWLRRVESLHELGVTALEKAVLNPFPATSGRHDTEEWWNYGGHPGVTLLPYLDSRAYDELLAENIVFLDLYDSTANNTIVECVVRMTPVLVNPLPAVVEYLGEGYPFYFSDLREAARKAQDTELVVAAHQYLRDASIRHKLTGDRFRQAFASSGIYRDLPSAAVRPQIADEVEWRGTATLRSPRMPRPAAIPGHTGRSRGGAPAVTLFTSVFAADDDLEPFLRDICGQTVFGSCELLLFDVCSSHRDPAAVRATIQAYRDAHTNIRYLPLASDPGLYQIWNRAVQLSGSPLLANANIDDRKAPDSLEWQIAALETNPGIDLVCGALLITTAPNETWESNSATGLWFANFANGTSDISSLGSRTEFGIEDLFLHDESGRRVDAHNMPHCMPMWRTSLHERFGLFDPWDFSALADWEFWLRCASRGARYMLLRREPIGLYYLNAQSHNRRLATGPVKARLLDRYLEKEHA